LGDITIQRREDKRKTRRGLEKQIKRDQDTRENDRRSRRLTQFPSSFVRFL
jgi:hypothetical protein